MYLPRLKQYCEELERQLEQIKTDPNTTLGQVINQARELYTQNSRLSVLSASLIDLLGGKVTVKKADMEKFDNHRVVVKWELPEGVEKAEDATEFVFLYIAEKNEQPQIQVSPAMHTTETPEGGEIATPVVTEASICGDAAAAIDGIPEAVANASLVDLGEIIAGTIEEVGVEEIEETSCSDPNCLHGDKASEGCVVPDVTEDIEESEPEQGVKEIT